MDELDLLRRERLILLTMAARLLAEKLNMPVDADVLSDVVGQQVRREAMPFADIESPLAGDQAIQRVVDESRRKTAAFLQERHDLALAQIAADLRGLPDHVIAEKMSEVRQRLAANRERGLEEVERVVREHLAGSAGAEPASSVSDITPRAEEP